MNLHCQHATRLAVRLGTSIRLPLCRPAPLEWRAVFFDGPQPGQDADGEEIPVWVVYIGDEDAEPTGRVYRCYSFSVAEGLARRMAKDRGLELVTEATTA
jgi:hypothetical protein